MSRPTASNLCKTCDTTFNTLEDEKHDECINCILEAESFDETDMADVRNYK